jgi:hypothetical protein
VLDIQFLVCAGEQCLPADFNCSIPGFTRPAKVPPTFPRDPAISKLTLIVSANSAIQESPNSEAQIVLLLLSSNGTDEDLNSNKNFGSYGDGEWTVFEMSKNFTFNMTLCFFS